MGNCVYCPSETEMGTILKESFAVNLIEQVPPVGFSLPKTSFLEILSFLKTLEKSSEKCIDLFCSKLSSLVQHNFIAKQQGAFFNYRKGYLKEFAVTCDFFENHSIARWRTEVSLDKPTGHNPSFCNIFQTENEVKHKLERVQLSAARIITGLRNSCPNKIVLYEADLQPLRFRGGAGLEKYFNKLISYGSHNRTSLFLRGWKSNQRLKKNSPMSLATELNLISREVECHSLKNCINPSEGLLGVFFHTELQQAVNKADTVPALLKQMALQLINEIPGVDIQIYTDGSKNEENKSGSGIYIKTPREVRKIKLRNPDNCSVFRSELLAIEVGLEAILNENNYGAVWILSDSRSSIQHLKDWNNVGDRTSISILKLLRHIGVDHEVHLQWIPSHVDIYENEVADNLAKQGTAEPLCSTPSLTFDEIYSIRKNKDLKTWRVPPSHDWYKRSSPGGSIGLACDRADQTRRRCPDLSAVT
ncbi:hypothetical protein AVEN_47890-1 [Araneus ventricosus]|uniref:ribonuclease H n=1 Tax=Araneus ventricosus TaxID=182803 RepID=A0A4Y2VZE7_ARAVE|nr:hypothetical protein AVEN_47890-1 [Araneus ventricosus]